MQCTPHAVLRTGKFTAMQGGFRENYHGPEELMLDVNYLNEVAPRVPKGDLLQPRLPCLAGLYFGILCRMSAVLNQHTE
ncbi:hypothetical protein OCU04_008302 [Sclerotinia nivalis]|uniref:Uncharacterized protein n=1 Tax=Sclerotinia nivalis TaxID=352851 RepID=A0A9X0DGW8_9HELO|nr:hypothetical protein OCU04_008302 [Sclerotinia nivalis]